MVLVAPKEGPCIALQSKRCQANPSDPTNQYKLVGPAWHAKNPGLPELACVCRSPLCWAHVELKEPPKKSGRKSRRTLHDMLAVTGQVRADLRSKPAVVEKILQIKGHRYVPAPPCPCAHAHCAFVIGRHTSIDCERSTIDEECLEARRSFLPKPHTVEYMIFGKFKMQAGGSSFKDTYFFTLRELKEGGFTKPEIKLALAEYEELLAAVECGEMGDISSEEEAGGEEDERGEGEVAGGEQAAAVVGGDVAVEDDVEEDDDDDSDDGCGSSGGYGLAPK